MKKLLRCVATTLIITLLLSTVVFAYAENEIQPRYLHIKGLTAGVKINTILGIATCESKIIVLGTNTVKIVCKLQYYDGTTWKTLKEWSKTGTTSASITGSYAISSGYMYRTFATGYVYNDQNVLIENATIADTEYY